MRPPILRSLTLTLVLLASAAPHAAAQTTPKDIADKAAETGEAIKAYTVERKDEALARAKQAVADLEAKIKELEVQASKQSGVLTAQSQAQLKELKAKRVRASEKLAALRRAAKASWETAKEGFVTAYRDLATAFDKAAGELKK